MTTRSLLLAALVLGLTSTACQPPAQEAGPLSDEDIAAIRTGLQVYVQALLAGDWAAAAAWHTEDAVRMPPNNTVVRGRAAIEARFAERIDTITAFTATSVEIEGRDGLAYDRHTYSMTSRWVGMSEPITNTGKALVVWQKQADGSWQAHRVMWNSDLPLPEPLPETDE